MNGFAHQGDPRKGGDVTYPFKSFDGRQTIDKQGSGQRVYDINVDGVAHYGLFPDWVEDLRHIGGQEVVDDLGRGAEAYLQMWERAAGRAADPLPAREGPRDAPRAHARAARRERGRAAAPRRPAAHARARVDLVRAASGARSRARAHARRAA